jgi:hypothetical protein
MIKVSTFLREYLNEIEMKKYLPPVSESSPHFRRVQANLSAPWMAPARRPMLQQGLKCFKEKNKNKNKNPPPPPPTEPSCTTAPPWGRGDWNATEPPANTHDRTKFIN